VKKTKAFFCLLSIFLSVQASALSHLGDRYEKGSWIRYVNINETQRDLLLSEDRKKVALPITLRLQNSRTGYFATCNLRVVTTFPGSESGGIEFGQAEVFLDDRGRLPVPENMDTCSSVNLDVAVAAASERFQELSWQQEKLLIFRDLVFVRESSEASVSRDFFKRFQGGYRWKFGSFVSLNPEKSLVTMNIPRPERDLFNEHLPKESFCDLKFQAPIDEVTVRAQSRESAQGYFLWIKSEDIGPHQVRCLKGRMTEQYLLERDGRVGIWIGLKKAREILLFFKVTWLGYL
jgi:hypothetical protein